MLFVFCTPYAITYVSRLDFYFSQVSPDLFKLYHVFTTFLLENRIFYKLSTTFGSRRVFTPKANNSCSTYLWWSLSLDPLYFKLNWYFRDYYWFSRRNTTFLVKSRVKSTSNWGSKLNDHHRFFTPFWNLPLLPRSRLKYFDKNFYF